MNRSPLAPTGLLCDLLAFGETTHTDNASPFFGWIFHDSSRGGRQSAWQILVASSNELLARNHGDLWDSGQVRDSRSINVPYAGALLVAHSDYYWKVRTWNSRSQPSPWSQPQRFSTGEIAHEYATPSYPLERFEVEPAEVVQVANGVYFADFGRAAFATLRLTLTSPTAGHVVEIHLGEALESTRRIARRPKGTVRYRKLELPLRSGTHTYTLEIPSDKRNTGPYAIALPLETGEVLPFRYCELVNCPSPVDARSLHQVAVRYPFDRKAATFRSSSRLLNRIWELCKYSIEATSFCGLYVDGDRERIPYEADAYINQLGHYCVDREFTLARRSTEYLLYRPSWPTEWILHSVLMAWADYLHTGDSRSIALHYATLQAKTLSSLAREDGLISTQKERLSDAVMDSVHYSQHTREFFGRPLGDIVDWPPGSFTRDGIGERDGYEMVKVNTVVNAFHYRALVLLGRMARVLGKQHDAERYERQAARVYETFQRAFFDSKRALYTDGEGSAHASLHANMFPLAFDLVPGRHRASVVAFIKSRGMACSVYGAQYLLEALYRAGEDDYALGLLTSESDRSWANMLRVGSTITLEAWDWKYKNNLDWNHAWGAAPANIVARYLMGVRPLEAGFGRVLIQPQPGSLRSARMRLPTVRGALVVGFQKRAGEFRLDLQIPGNVTARVGVPRGARADSRVEVDGESIEAKAEGDSLFVEELPSGRHRLLRSL